MIVQFAIGTSGADGVLATRVVVLSEATAVATETGREATVTALAVATVLATA